MLEVRNLSVEIKNGKLRLSAVSGISFTVGTGEIAGIAGDSGCGKSLTALSILRLLPRGAEQTEGSIRLNGLELTKLGEKELCRVRGKEIGIIFQEPMGSLNPLQKIGKQIGEVLRLHGERDSEHIRKRSLGIMGRLGLPEPVKLYDAYPHQLSGGMCQRVMIAMAVISRPRLLIADEPTTALDVTIQGQILELLKRINQALGVSILFISHDLKIIRRLCTRVFFMYAGKIVEEGPAEAVFARPCHEYTRGLLASIPERGMKGKPLPSIAGKVPSLEEGRPSGCPFRPRCGRAVPLCGAAFPAGTDLGGGRRVHCILAAPRGPRPEGG
jgi:peptide/nickel transport system ATP-binding protein